MDYMNMKKPEVKESQEVKEPRIVDIEEAVQIQEAGRIEYMNERAIRIYEGQSPHLPVRERVNRIRNALLDLDFKLEQIKQVKLPIENLSRYL